jgi:hypothetical protein
MTFGLFSNGPPALAIFLVLVIEMKKVSVVRLTNSSKAPISAPENRSFIVLSISFLSVRVFLSSRLYDR